jgi:alpha-glucosidase
MSARRAVRDEWWRGAVVYQIYPRSFADSNNDGVGDLRGITEHLAYVAHLGVDAIWISPSSSRRWPISATTWPTTGRWTRCSAPGRFRRPDRPGPCAGTEGDDRPGAFPHLHRARLVPGEPGQPRQPRADWYVWADPQPDGTPPNNWLSVFGGPAWHWDSQRRQYYLHSFLASQADLNFHHPAVQEALLGEVRFWCERGVDGFRFDACNHQFHDRALRSNPPASAAEQAEVSTVRPDNPYAMQRHLHDKTQPENLAFLERLRALLDEYGAASIGEVGDEHPLPVMADYTEAGKRLHMAYSFALLTPEASGPHIREQVQGLEAELARTGGWGCWALSNHDVPRVATRWAPHGQPDDALSATLLALLLTLKGSVCLYQGEELGLPEADIPFARLQDPYGKAFWPRFKGATAAAPPCPGGAMR